VPLSWTGAASAVLAIALALALLITDRREAMAADSYGPVRSQFDRVVEPISGVLAAPARWIRESSDFVGGYFFAVSENRRLKARVAELERWRDAAVALKNINTRYEALLQLRTEPPIPMVTARVVTDSRGPFSHARLADSGSDRGVRVGNPVLSERGVVGRVVGVTRGASRVLLLTDIDSRTPVLIDRTNARAILTGDGGAAPRLDYVRGREALMDGDLILTSGDGGIYPRGLPVGVAARDARGVWRARLYADQAAIDYVRILVFDDFSQTVDQAALASSPIPPLSAEERAAIEAAASGRTAPLIALPQPAAPAPSAPASSPSSAAAPRPAARPPAPAPAPRPAPAPAPRPAAPPAGPPPTLDGLF
jgi:rod shape-determining protein MreC